MTTTHWLLSEESPHWRLSCTTNRDPQQDIVLAQAESPESLAQQIAKHLEQRGYRGEGILLALASASCLPATLAAEQGTSRTALLFQLEEQLPLAAEEIVTDFVFTPDATLAIAVQTARIKPLLEALHQRGIAIQTITPLVFLALQQAREADTIADATVALWRNRVQFDLLEIVAGQPVQWQSFPATLTALQQQLSVRRFRERGVGTSTSNPAPPSTVARDAALLFSPLTSETALCVLEPTLRNTDCSLSQHESALAITEAILTGRITPWIDLRRDELAPAHPYRPVKRLLVCTAVAAATCLLTLIAALQWRSFQYEQANRHFQNELIELYRQTLPGQPIPAGVRSRLQSELAKFTALRGNSINLPHDPSALVVMHEALAALPTELRLRIMELRVERGRIHLDVELRSHSDADTLATALRSRGFEVAPPSSQQSNNQSVLVAFTARWNPVSPTAEPS